MKRHQFTDTYSLDEREKATLWRAIRRPASPRRGSPQLFIRLGVTVAVAAIAVVVLQANWRTESHRVRDLLAERQATDVAVLSPDAAPATPAPVDNPTPPSTTAHSRQEIIDRLATVEVRLRDASSGKPLDYANVKVESEAGSKQTMTLGGGEAKMLVEPGVEQTISVNHLGYESVDRTVTPAPGETMTVALDMKETVAGSLDEFEVEGSSYMVETTSVKSNVEISSEKFEKYAIDSVDQALARQPAGMPSTPAPPAGAESGGTANPNDRPYDLVYHEHYGVNPFVAAEDDALSTFAVDVDDASWAVARRYLHDGHLPPKEAVRLEEFVNAFDPGWPAVESGDDFAIRVDGAPSRYGEGYHLLRIGIQGREITAAQRRPADLIFVIDVSGSMDRENRLGLVKQSLRVLVDELREGDRVGIVVYGSEARIVLEPVSIEHRTDILAAIDGLAPDGSTNAEAGLRLAYGIARRGYDPQAINRLILCSDGVANVGETGADEILESVRREADRGIMLTTIGFGMGNFNDVLMEKLADGGDGTYHYVDRLDEAERVFRQNLTGTLQTLGRDGKVQVEFDPAAVDRWRLLGYENRDVADRDFRNDAVDAGEIGSGHTVVALYEVKLTDRARRAWKHGDRDAPLATVRFRWEHPRHDPRAGEVEEIERRIVPTDIARNWDRATPRLRLAATVAEFAEILRGSFWAKESCLGDLLPEADRLTRDLDDDTEVQELRDLIRRAATLNLGDDNPDLPPPIRD
jgi:Ca-activated chloride channel family protein